MTQDSKKAPTSQQREPAPATIRAAIIDRFEGELAVLLVQADSSVEREAGCEEAQDEVRNVPRSKLPPEAREGDVVDLGTFRLLPGERERNDARVKAAASKSPARSGNFDL